MTHSPPMTSERVPAANVRKGQRSPAVPLDDPSTTRRPALEADLAEGSTAGVEEADEVPYFSRPRGGLLDWMPGRLLEAPPPSVPAPEVPPAGYGSNREHREATDRSGYVHGSWGVR